VGGIPLSVDEVELIDYFQQFGKIKECTIQRHKKLKLSRGYGFVKFISKEDAMRCINFPMHTLNGRNISCSIAKSKTEALNDVFQKQYNKLFIGGVSTELTEEILFDCFSKFGNVEKIYLIYDKITGKSKGFGFLEYKSYEVAKKVADARYIVLNDCKIEVKPKLLKRDAQLISNNTQVSTKDTN
jgi:RNA recognition motif-containing protein